MSCINVNVGNSLPTRTTDVRYIPSLLDKDTEASLHIYCVQPNWEAYIACRKVIWPVK